MPKCKYLKNYKQKRLRTIFPECTNKDCEYYGEECVEKDTKEPIECEYKRSNILYDDEWE